MLSPTKRDAILDEGRFKKRVANDEQEVRRNVEEAAREQGAADDEIADILQDFDLLGLFRATD